MAEDGVGSNQPEDGQTVHYMGVFSDLTERKATAAAIERLVRWLREPRHRRQEPEPPEVSSDEPAFCWG